MKKNFINPVICIEEFSVESIVTLSLTNIDVVATNMENSGVVTENTYKIKFNEVINLE